MTTRYLDFTNGNDSNNGSSFALRKKTLASAVSGLTGGDTVRVMQSPDPTSLGQSATWTNGSDTVTLTTAVTANINDCETAWTAAANVTATASTTTYRENTKSANLAIAGAFTTGLAAYAPTAVLGDYSAYQQISLLVRTSINVAANVLQLSLCSDTVGAVQVNTINLPAITANYWTPVVVDTGAALGAVINSVALYAASDPGSVTVNLDNIIACKASSSADSLTHLSLIGKNTGGTEPWFAIDSINGTTVRLGTGIAATAAKGLYACTYRGATEAVTTCKREPIMLSALETCSTAGVSMDNPLYLEFGWDTTDMSTQPGVTWLRQANPSINGIQISGSYDRTNKVYAVSGGAAGIVAAADRIIMDEFGATASNKGVQCSSNDLLMLNGKFVVGCLYSVYLTSTTNFGFNSVLKIAKLWGISESNISGSAIYDVSTGGYGHHVVCNINEIKGFANGIGGSSSGGNRYTFNNTVFANNYLDINNLTYCVTYYFNNCVQTSSQGNTYQREYHTKYNQTENDHRILWGDLMGSWITTATDRRHTTSGISWKFSPLNVTHLTSYQPMYLSVVQLACPANEARSVSLWFLRNNSGLSQRLRLPGGQIAGVPTDITASVTEAVRSISSITRSGSTATVTSTAHGYTTGDWVEHFGMTQTEYNIGATVTVTDADAYTYTVAGTPATPATGTTKVSTKWQQLTINFTPTEAGVVEVFADAWGGATYSGWVDDLSRT